MEVAFITEPIVSLGSNKIIAMEALSRFKLRDGMQISPIQILNMLNSEGKARLLNKQIEWIVANKSVFIENDIICSVNIDEDLCAFIYENRMIQEVIKKNNFIAFEISETHPNLDINDSVIDFLFDLSEYIWLDDFGSGNATMSAVINRPYHAIKLDKNFIQRNVKKHTISDTIREIKKFVPHVIAEGIENEVYHNMSIELDLWGRQGYYYSSRNVGDYFTITSDFLTFDFFEECKNR
ncbi:TPA: EAL domain-containing protein [Escherichia coli]|nr:EAL domain-containing protein [Escherichia coli]